MPSHSGLLTVMDRAARKAAPRLRRDFNEVQHLQVSRKGPADFVSMADQRAEQTIFEELSKARPDWGFLMEERGEIAGDPSKPRFIVDPLDGTTNFLHGLPLFAISIALVREDQIVAGLIFNPGTDEMYVTEKGQGAFLNATRMRVAARRKLSDSLIACGIPPLARAKHHPLFKQEFAALLATSGNLRRLGSAALDLAAVAAGRFDGYWERNIHSWDVTAGALMVREAGGFVSTADGTDDIVHGGSILAGNEYIQREMLAAIKGIG